MSSRSSSPVPYFQRNLYIPPLSPEHVDKIFANHIQDCSSLPCTICSYLKSLAYIHYQGLRVSMDCLPYELDPHDLMMYFLGMDAPLSMIMAASCIADQKYQQVFSLVCLPPDCDDFLHYNVILQNRIHEGIHLITIDDERTVLKVFDYLCDRPFYRKEDYFLAGCETSKLLYKKVITEIDKILDYDYEPKQ